MRVLVTGAAGQVGSELSRLGTEAFQPIGLSRDDLDITDAAAVAHAIERWQPQAVVNCAAYTAVDRAENDEKTAHAVNVEAVAHLAAACARSGAALVHVSTDYVFDGNADAPYREEDDTAPLGVYGRTKELGERAARAGTPRHIILRISWVFGTLGRSFVDTMLRLARERPELTVVDDQIGAPAPAKAVAETLRTICLAVANREDLWGTYHFSAEPAVSWCGFARQIVEGAERLGLIDQAPEVRAIPTTEYPTPAMRPLNSRLNATQLARTFGIQPPDWRPHLRAYLKSLRPAP
ncbi:MAG: dTDP-4-dehydrorhamnose reductase [Gammaproteobacteria bacterium]|nr:dTDP-4-dehydrorhamnose reductase [Gammaproteobacteria bacterium]